MDRLRVIGDVHAQIDFVVRRGKPTYLELIAGCPCSIQIGDMGDGEAYETLTAHVDPQRHRFFPGNHDHYDCLPAHSLGDFGQVLLGGVAFFFVRGAASLDKDKLLRMGRETGRRLWFEQEELTESQMEAARTEFARVQPAMMISHDAPTRIASFVQQDVSRPGTPLRTSRTSDFLETLLEIHRPQLWLFGHYHQDWSYVDEGTRFCCVGELSFRDIDAHGNIWESAG